MTITRRELLSLAVTSGALFLGREHLSALDDSDPDLKLRIAPAKIEIAPGSIIPTTAYNGGTLVSPIRMREGIPVHVEITNDTDMEEYVHWHGFFVPASLDGAMEEKSFPVPRWRKTQLSAHPATSRRAIRTFAHNGRSQSYVWFLRDAQQWSKCGTYSGQFGFVYIEPKSDLGRYDQEMFLSTHEWDRYLTNDQLDEQTFETPEQQERERQASKIEPDHWEVAYRSPQLTAKRLATANRSE